jgi:hypothetical protein
LGLINNILAEDVIRKNRGFNRGILAQEIEIYYELHSELSLLIGSLGLIDSLIHEIQSGSLNLGCSVVKSQA